MTPFPPRSLPQLHISCFSSLGPCDQAKAFLRLLPEGKAQDQQPYAGNLTVGLTMGAFNIERANFTLKMRVGFRWEGSKDCIISFVYVSWWNLKLSGTRAPDPIKSRCLERADDSDKRDHRRRAVLFEAK